MEDVRILGDVIRVVQIHEAVANCRRVHGYRAESQEHGETHNEPPAWRLALSGRWNWTRRTRRVCFV